MAAVSWTSSTLVFVRDVDEAIGFYADRLGVTLNMRYAEEDKALVTLIRKGWGRNMPTFRQVFTSQYFRSDADPGLIAHFNELQRLSEDPDTAARYYESCHSRGDGHDDACAVVQRLQRTDSLSPFAQRLLLQLPAGGRGHPRRLAPSLSTPTRERHSAGQ